MAIPLIKTSRLVIRDVLASDADGFHAYMRQEHYWRDLPIDPPTAWSVRSLVDAALLDQAAEPRVNYFLAVTAQASGELIGEAILRIRGARPLQAEIGWGLGSGHTGQGYATEAGMAMLRLGFDTLGLHRIYARCRIENHASCRIMNKLGMRQEGVFRDDVLARGTFWSSIQCAILSTD